MNLSVLTEQDYLTLFIGQLMPATGSIHQDPRQLPAYRAAGHRL